MVRVVVAELGKLTLVEDEALEPGPGQLAVAVGAAGVNYVDGLLVEGRYQIKPPLPFTPGSEIAGTVSAVGPGVTGFAPGDRVLAMCGFGGFAAHAVINADSAVRVPDALDFPRAATFTQSYCTALFALRERVGLRAGESVLSLGAGSGVGLAAVQVAKALGARVLAAASSPEKRAASLAAGASEVVDSADPEAVKKAARAFGDGGVDVVFDPVGGELAPVVLRALREFGRYTVIGFTAGIPAVPLNQVLLRNRSVVGVDWGLWALTGPDRQRALLEDALTMVADGRLDPVAPQVRPLADVAEVIADLQARRVVGKVALVP
ncbi:NADPH:quinone oxidoreductase family protein [Actinocorallia sp. API 0066]|uniref:NADPH:quinone oxidoreductase family protein n=1 Tax=Actinocorallia sp. API 0066 TaxID=2896846 RepID=UPI001E3FA21D|nr:NADPH:quinone oxidoreductase family protein [Actinocorallia sp. API 0066]MCD0452382.1 NADPH:quinone oxidoreductase family protein [Actinocorallia sp. API 0066]